MDGYRCLSYLPRWLGDLKSAVKWAKQGISVKEDHTEASFLLPALQMEQKNWYNAKQLLHKLVNGAKCQDDPYALLANPTLNLYSAPGGTPEGTWGRNSASCRRCSSVSFLPVC